MRKRQRPIGLGILRACRLQGKDSDRMSRPCKIVFSAFLLLYVAALGLLAVGTFGLFGAERDPLSGVFLVPLGLPWILLIDTFPEPLLPWFGAASPLVNLLAIWLVCRARRAARP
jgi:hypothetical protein